MVHNARRCRNRARQIKGACWSNKSISPVQWTRCVQTMAGAARHIVECGPGKVLSGLSRRIDKSLRVFTR